MGEVLAGLLAQHVVGGERVDRFEALVYAVHLKQGALDPTPQSPLPHRRAGPVYGLYEPVQPEVAPRRAIQHHPGAGRVGPEGHDLLRRASAAQRGEILQERSRGAYERVPPVEAQALEVRDAEVALQRLLPGRRLEGPTGGRAYGRTRPREILCGGAFGDDQLLWRPAFELGGELVLGHLGPGELAGRGLRDRHARPSVPDDDGGEVVRLPDGEDVVLDHGAGGEDARDLAGKLLRLRRMLALPGDCDGAAAANE